MTPVHQPRSSFVIRIWWEEAGDSQPIWRGWVQHTRSGEAAYVQDLDELLAFIERRTGKLAVPDRPPAWLR
jgi:hypothetical protein